ncbi:MAG: hypothetical protein Q7S17_03450 [Xanthobacteraceae bacterium]|jgi:hypothetical protein|nr:hypothetical protein [Xanthobacteraceae bacterium]
MNQPGPDPTDVSVYRFRRRMIGAEIELSLAPGVLVWRGGSREVAMPLSGIKRVRLGLRPSGLMSRRCIAEVWPATGGRIEISSTTMRGLLDVQDNGPAYRAFVVELHRRIAAAHADCRFEAGFPPWRWWPAAAIGALTLAGCIYVTIYALLAGHFGAGLALAGFTALFVWQSGVVVVRNRPRRYSPDAIPRDLLPHG